MTTLIAGRVLRHDQQLPAKDAGSVTLTVLPLDHGFASDAISLLTEANQAHLRLIEKRHRLQLPREVVAGFEPQAAAPSAAGTPVTGADNGGIKGKRPSKKDRLRAAQAAGQ